MEYIYIIFIYTTEETVTNYYLNKHWCRMNIQYSTYSTHKDVVQYTNVCTVHKDFVQYNTRTRRTVHKDAFENILL